MTGFPFLTAGRLGVIEHSQLSEFYERGSTPTQNQQRAPTPQFPPGLRQDVQREISALFVRENGADVEGNAALGRTMRWQEVGQTIDGLWNNDIFRKSNWADPEIHDDGAELLTSPRAMLYPIFDTAGRRRYVAIPAPSVIFCELVISGVPPVHTYNVTALGGLIDELQMEPINRWPNIDYEAAHSDFGLLMVMGQAPQDLRLIAFESPMFAQCPEPSGTVPLEQFVAV